MMHIDEIKWEDGHGLEEILTQGIIPSLQLLDLVYEDVANNVKKPVVGTVMSMLQNLLKSTGQGICRFQNELNELDGRKSDPEPWKHWKELS